MNRHVFYFLFAALFFAPNAVMATKGIFYPANSERMFDKVKQCLSSAKLALLWSEHVGEGERIFPNGAVQEPLLLDILKLLRSRQ